MAGRFDVLCNDSEIEIDMDNVMESVKNIKEEAKGKTEDKMTRKRTAQNNRKTSKKTQKIAISSEEDEVRYKQGQGEHKSITSNGQQ